ncbi:MAG: SRPBCC domain-containing protein [Proteobacteria bacterium]|nr:SRPBCC domain-containing protein [Pseudomonadota bacterium]
MAASAASSSVKEPQERVLVIERRFSAPRELVWDAFTRPEHLVHWMGPRRHPAAKFEADVRPGGKWRGCLRATDGSGDLWQGGMFHEVVRPERLVYTFQWDRHPEQTETIITITFEDEGDRTLMRFHQAVFSTVPSRDDHNQGWNSCFDRLDDYLKTL